MELNVAARGGAGPEPGTDNLTSTHQQKGWWRHTADTKSHQQKENILPVCKVQYYAMYFCMFTVWILFFFLLSFFLLAITKDVNTRKHKTLIVKSFTAPSRRLVSGDGKKKKEKSVMCVTSFMRARCHMCMQVHYSRCPLDINHTPLCLLLSAER